MLSTSLSSNDPDGMSGNLSYQCLSPHRLSTTTYLPRRALLRRSTALCRLTVHSAASQEQLPAAEFSELSTHNPHTVYSGLNLNQFQG